MRISFVIRACATLAAVLFLGIMHTSLTQAADVFDGSITLDSVSNMHVTGNSISYGNTKFFLRFKTPVSGGYGVWAFTFPFKVFSNDGASWSQFHGEYIPGTGNYQSANPPFVQYESNDGHGSDSLQWVYFPAFGGEDVWPSGTDVVPFTISLTIDPSSIGKTICLDSITNFPESGTWVGVLNTGSNNWYPSWGGSYCFTVTDCCQGMRGNIDSDPGDHISILDANYMIMYMFNGGPAPACFSEADIDASGVINILDFLYLRNWMFYGGPQPLACP